VFRIFSKFGAAEGETPLINVAVDTGTGVQPWGLSIGESVSAALDAKTVPFSAVCITNCSKRADYYRQAGVPVGLARDIPLNETELVIGANPAAHLMPKETAEGDLTFLLGGGDIDTDPHEARKLIRLLRKERAACFIKSCQKRETGGFYTTVSESDAPLFCVECDKEDIECKLVDGIAEGCRPQNREWPDCGPQIAAPAKTPQPWDDESLSPAERLLLLVSSPSFCSQQGLCELFDSTVGAGGVLAPHGGLAAAAPEQAAAALIPARGSRTAVLAAYAEGVFSAVTSAAKLVASGCGPDEIYSYLPQGNTGFAVGTAPASRVLSSHFMRRGSLLYLLEAPVNPDGTPDIPRLAEKWECFHAYVLRGAVLSAYACEFGGVVGAMAHMSLSGLNAKAEFYDGGFFSVPPGSIVFESPQHIEGERVVGVVQQKTELQLGDSFIPLQSFYTAWWQPMEAAFPTELPAENKPVPFIDYIRRAPSPVHLLNARPLALAPVFPGTTGEVEMAEALKTAGAVTETPIIRTSRPDWLEQSAEALGKSLRKAQMLILHGSGDFIAEFFKRPQLADALRDLLDRRGGLLLGISGGFNALVNLGLLPGGGFNTALEVNSIGTHRSRYIHTRVSSVLSPWLMRCATGEIHAMPVSCAAGCFTVSAAEANALINGGQVAFQYCDARGMPSHATFINPTGSALAAEGVTSPDGRILGKIAHPERAGFYIGKNIPGNKAQPIFEGGVRYFR
jgi:phosphoribosylformylglycinamidine synthase